MSNANHTMNSQEHYTPKYIVELAKKVLGTIDLDVCSSAIANKTVQATEYFTKEDDSLSKGWCSEDREPLSVWCNPPGSKHIRPSLPMQFWRKLTFQTRIGNVSHALYLAYSLEQLQQAQKLDMIPMLDFPLCIPSKRIAFLGEDGIPQKSPPHANAIIYVPGIINNTQRFKKVFSEIGYVKI